MSTAVVVGSGPNGLAAAVRLARSGVDVQVLEAAEAIGGGTRSSELTVAGVIHDHCSAFHSIVLASPFIRSLDLERHGLRWRWPEIDAAHPLDGGTAALLHRSIEETADGLGADGPRWRRTFAPLARRFDDLAEEILQPVAHVPRHPLTLARFGLRALPPPALWARWFRTEAGRALFGGFAVHAFRPLDRPLVSAIGLTLLACGHRHGWPVAEGGSQAIADALVADLEERGGKVRTGIRVRRAADLPDADVVLFDLAPGAVADIMGDRLPGRVARAYRRFRHGPGAFKVDLAIEGDVPWTAPDVARAGTVHLGGSFEEMAASERDISRGRMPERPFVLVGQQYKADPTRSAGNVNPLWTYAHVPHGYTGDATEAVLGQIERFAPGFRERIVARAVRSTTDFPIYNPNYVGGDIMTGANVVRQIVMRPRPAIDPYSTGVRGFYICSAASPPGPGAHGMCGFYAAGSALRHLRIR